MLNRATLTVGLAVGLAGGVAFGVAVGPAVGLLAGVITGLAASLLFGLAVGVRHLTGDAVSPVDPITSWCHDRRYAVAMVVAFCLVGGVTSGVAWTLAGWLVIGILGGLVGGLLFGFAIGLGFGLAVGLADCAAWPAALAFAQLALHGQAPPRLLRFLEDARDRQVLRVAGPVYQFRHARLRERLARAYEDDDAARAR